MDRKAWDQHEEEVLGQDAARGASGECQCDDPNCSQGEPCHGGDPPCQGGEGASLRNGVRRIGTRVV